MQQPTEQQEEEWAELGAVVVEAPEVAEDFAVYLRPLSLTEFRDMANGSVHEKTRQNAVNQAVLRAALHPSRSEITAGMGVFSGLTKRCSDALQEMAGSPPKDAQDRWTRLDRSTKPEELQELGVAPELVADLLASYSAPGQLWSCILPATRVRFIVKRPTLACANRLMSNAQEEGLFFGAALDAAVDCIVWAAEGDVASPLEKVGDLLKRYPAVATNVLFPQLLKLFKGEATQGAKKLMPKGRRLGA